MGLHNSLTGHELLQITVVSREHFDVQTPCDKLHAKCDTDVTYSAHWKTKRLFYFRTLLYDDQLIVHRRGDVHLR